MPKQINKALSPEEATALSNIQSILNEILQMNSGDSGSEPEAGSTPADNLSVAASKGEDEGSVADKKEDELEAKKGMKVNRAMEETPSEGETANDDAEERIEDQMTPQAEDAIQEVAKALVSLMKPASVKKSVQKSELATVLETIVAVQKSTADQVSDLSTAFENILEGMGITKQIQVAKSVQTQKPVVSPDKDALLEVLKSALGLGVAKTEETVNTVKKSNPAIIRKNFSDPNVLAGMLRK